MIQSSLNSSKWCLLFLQLYLLILALLKSALGFYYGYYGYYPYYWPGYYYYPYYGAYYTYTVPRFGLLIGLGR